MQRSEAGHVHFILGEIGVDANTIHAFLTTLPNISTRLLGRIKLGQNASIY